MSRADGYVSHDAIIKKLRELGFSFKRQADRVMIYRRGDGAIVQVPRRELIPIAWVRSQFQLFGQTIAEIEQFISDAAC